MSRITRFALIFFWLIVTPAVLLHAARYMENLNRGVVAVRVNTNTVYVGWRLLANDPAGIAFNLYRDSVRLNAAPITASTNYTDTTTANGTYTVRSVIGGVEQAASAGVTPWAQQFITIPLSQPAMMTMPDGVTCTFTPNDCSTGDLDGDGEYEIVLKWDPTNSKDNSQSGYTGDVFLDAYKLNGMRLWRIDLGKNIRAGAHYTQFQVYDYDSDGKAELACKTAPGTTDSSGAYLSYGPAASDTDTADYRNSSGYILSGPEYLTVFNGQTGREMYTTSYNPARGTVSSWGDSYGNRVDRFLACTAYLDGVHPSLVMCRGYYTRCVIAAYDWNGSVLTQRWVFDSNTSGNSAYAGQGNHGIAVGDVDGDGRDEIMYGAAAIDDNGAGLYSTGRGHGDAGHLGKMDPDRAGMQWFQPHESAGTTGGGDYRDAATGTNLWAYASTGDTGRGLAADIDANYRGWEFWTTSTDGTYNVSGAHVSTSRPSVNFRIYWDADLQDELLDGTKLDKWTGSGTTRLFTFYNYGSSQEINGTKANPCLTADILGDWREEVIYRNSNNQELNIFTTVTQTNYRFYTFMHDLTYRTAVAWQNTAYNQPPHISFYLADNSQPAGDIMPAGAPTPGGSPTRTRTVTPTSTPTATPTPLPAGYKEIQLEYPCSMDGVLEASNAGYTGAGYANLNNAAGTALMFSLYSTTAQSAALLVRYANGSATDRAMSVSVNGIVQLAGVSFPGTGAWTTWLTASMNLNLQQGYNTVLMTSLSAEGAPNLDMVSFVSASISDGGCSAPSPTPTVTMTRTATPTMTATRTITRTATQSATATATDTASPTHTIAVNTPTPFTPSATMTFTPTDTAASPTMTVTMTCTHTDTFTATATPTATATQSPTLSPMPATVTPTGTATPLPPGYAELQAEETCSYDGSFEAIHAGYTGTGYANLYNTAGSTVVFYLDSAAAGSLTLSCRFANGSANERDMNVTVNGAAAGSFAFPSTAAWTAWTTSAATVALAAGRNEIVLTSITSEGGPNLDMLFFASTSVTIASCVPPETPTETETEVPSPTTQAPSSTCTQTMTATQTAASTATQTAASTATQTAASTATQTAASTATQTAASTATQTSVSTAAYTATLTATQTFTPTATRTSTPTRTITLTASGTFTRSATPTSTPLLSTVTPTCTITATVVTAATPVMYPNPYVPGAGPITVRLFAAEPYTSFELTLYTTSFRKVARAISTADCNGSCEAQFVSERFRTIARGSYYCTVYGITPEGTAKRLLISVLTVVRP